MFIKSPMVWGRTCVLRRYDINSNSPSGGINDIVRSFSNLDKRTHWWNFTSSISIPLLGFPNMEHVAVNNCTLR